MGRRGVRESRWKDGKAIRGGNVGSANDLFVNASVVEADQLGWCKVVCHEEIHEELVVVSLGWGHCQGAFEGKRGIVNVFPGPGHPAVGSEHAPIVVV
jgi:hypothetical protein